MAEWVPFLILILAAVATPLYWWLSTGLLGHTEGKRWLGMKVTDEHGNIPGLKRALLRELLKLISFMTPLFLGFIWIIWDKQKQGWHDRVARTYVVMEKTDIEMVQEARAQPGEGEKILINPRSLRFVESAKIPFWFGKQAFVLLTNERLVIKKVGGMSLSEGYNIQNVNWALSHLEGESIPLENITGVKAGRNIRLMPYLRVTYQAPAGQKVYTFWQDEEDRTQRHSMKDLANAIGSAKTRL